MTHIDNINNRLADDLKQEIKKGSKLSIAASTFSIYAFEALKKELKSIDGLRFIFTSPTFIEEDLQKEARQFYIPHIFNDIDLCGGEFELRLRNELTQRSIARECAAWVRDKVTFKSNKRADMPLHGLVHVVGAESEAAYTQINGFTTADLGLSPRKGFPTLIQKITTPQTNAYLQWFDQVWDTNDSLKDVTDAVVAYFASAYKENSPEFIYFVTLYNIFNDFLKDVARDNLPDDEIGFKHTEVWKKLYNFQRDAVIGAINKLEKYNGCILADSVGLGKTFTALGIIKYYEKRNKDVLVLCPKKLEANWNTYRHNDKNNMLAKDRFRYDVLFHTDLTRKNGMSNGRELANVNWGNYGLIVIDESHNFRNNNANAGRENRYQALLRKVVQEGIETKVLMLSATPVNNRFNDLKNQLALAYEGAPESIDKKLSTEQGIDLVFRRAQAAFNVWSKMPADSRTTERLLEMLDFDFFEILDSLTIARSRKHITTYYDTTDIGKFPQRNKPVSIQSPLVIDGITFEEVANALSLLNLSVYSPLSYILPSKVAEYKARYEKKVKSGAFSQLDRERSLQVLMRINLLKRIESSVDSFRLTIKKIETQISDILNAFDKHAESVNGVEIDPTDEDFDWDADWGDEENLIGGKVKVRLADVDITRWREDLQSDSDILHELLSRIKEIVGKTDLKLEQLKDIIDAKVKAPFNDGNKKVLIFTAFADTAIYLYKSLKDYLKWEYGFNCALITGSTRQTTAADVPTELNALLTCFSPVSKGKDLLYPSIQDSIDVVIATDCISEGQNLQDCDFLINYDIHWNPVRIIQRFGRIDRIGSRNKSISMVNFWPDVTLDAYINLKQRVENRMLISNMTSTGDDNILNDKEKDLEYRKIQLQKLKDEVVDLEDLREGVSITDLGLNDFRVDLSNYVREFGELKKIPQGLHAAVEARSEAEKGVIFVLNNINTTVNIDKLNRLHPYYLVYIKQTGEILYSHTDAKKILDIMRHLAKGVTEPIVRLCDELYHETADYKNMSVYSQLLQKSIASILKTEEEKEVLSLFKAGGTTALVDKIKGIEDFKLISFFIVK